MTHFQNYRSQAIEFAQLAGRSNSPEEQGLLARAARAYTVLAENEEWMAFNVDKVVSADPTLKDQADLS